MEFDTNDGDYVYGFSIKQDIKEFNEALNEAIDSAEDLEIYVHEWPTRVSPSSKLLDAYKITHISNLERSTLERLFETSDWGYFIDPIDLIS